MRFLLVLTVIVLIEAAAFATVSNVIGGLPAVLGMALTTLGGFALLGRQGRATLRQLDAALRGDGQPGAVSRELWLALSAALFAFPGYASDVLGLVLLLPPARVLLRDFVFIRLVAILKRPPANVRARVIIEGDFHDDSPPPRNLPRP